MCVCGGAKEYIHFNLFHISLDDQHPIVLPGGVQYCKVFSGGGPLSEGGCSSPQRLRVESRAVLSSAETSTDSGDMI